MNPGEGKIWPDTGPAVGPEGSPWNVLLDKGSPTVMDSSFQGVRSTMGMVIASHGTTGFLEGKNSTFSTFFSSLKLTPMLGS